MSAVARDLLEVPLPDAPEKRSAGTPELRRNRIRRTIVHHHTTICVGLGKLVNGERKVVKDPYQRYRCSYKCGYKSRGYCSCDPTAILCDRCFPIHFAEVFKSISKIRTSPKVNGTIFSTWPSKSLDTYERLFRPITFDYSRNRRY